MSEVLLKDHSIHEPSTLHVHPLETIPQGSQDDGVLNGHDHRDVDAGILGKCMIGLFVLIIFSVVVTVFFTQGLLNSLARNDVLPSATYGQRDDLENAWPVEPGESKLQSPDAVPALLPDPEKPMIVLREQDETRLEGYDWAKDEKGRQTGVSIPVDRAIELTLQRGLPSEQRARVKIEEPSGDVVAIGSIPPSETMLKREILNNKNGGEKKREGATHD